jgi:hypothetical protein
LASQEEEEDYEDEYQDEDAEYSQYISADDYPDDITTKSGGQKLTMERLNML